MSVEYEIECVLCHRQFLISDLIIEDGNADDFASCPNCGGLFFWVPKKVLDDRDKPNDQD